MGHECLLAGQMWYNCVSAATKCPSSFPLRLRPPPWGREQRSESPMGGWVGQGLP